MSDQMSSGDGGSGPPPSSRPLPLPAAPRQPQLPPAARPHTPPAGLPPGRSAAARPQLPPAAAQPAPAQLPPGGAPQYAQLPPGAAAPPYAPPYVPPQAPYHSPLPPQQPPYSGGPFQYPAGAAPSPAAPGRARGPVFAATAAAVAAAALVAGLLIWSPWNGSGGSGPVLNTPKSATDDPAAVAAATLRAAAENLASAGAVSYEGTFHDSSDLTTAFTLQTTPGGWARGTLGQGGETVEVLTAGGNIMVKAGKDYWSGKDYADAMVKRFAGRWVDAQSELPDAKDMATPLSPSHVAGLMREAADAGRVSAGARTTVDGTAAQRFYTPAGRYYVTTAKPYRLVRVESASDSDDSDDGSGSGADSEAGDNALPDGVDATVSQLSGDADKTFRSALATDIGRLKTAVDPAVTFSTVGKSSFTPCGNTSCTAKFTIKNTVYDSLRAPGPGGDTSVYAVITVDITLDGHQVKHCSYTRKMAAEGTVSVTCKATYSSSAYTDHTVRGLPDAWARAVPDAELKKLEADFAAGVAATGGDASGSGSGTSA